MRLEAEIQADVRLCLGQMPGVVVWRNSTGVANTADGKKQRFGLCVGSSDLVGIVDGRFLAVEIKAKAGRLRPEQELFLALVRKQKGFACVVRSVDEAIAAIARARLGLFE